MRGIRGRNLKQEQSTFFLMTMRDVVVLPCFPPAAYRYNLFDLLKLDKQML